MGWAKCYEDNLSIFNNRLPLTCEEEKEYLILEHTYIYKEEKAVVLPKQKRAELEIHFFELVDRIAARKLQINGWWWSKLNNCWCNYNTAINREFAEQFNYKNNVIRIAV